jgi:hypothetical protein
MRLRSLRHLYAQRKGDGRTNRDPRMILTKTRQFLEREVIF